MLNLHSGGMEDIMKEKMLEEFKKVYGGDGGSEGVFCTGKS